MPVRPPTPATSLADVSQRADSLLQQHAGGLARAVQLLREFHPRFTHASGQAILSAELELEDAQLAIAREHGYDSWARLVERIEHPSPIDLISLRHDERIENPVFRRAVHLFDTGDADGLATLLSQHPNLVLERVSFEGGNYFRSPTLLEFIAENPVRHGKLPANVTTVARIILEAGPDLESRNAALMLVATGSVARECGAQRPLIDLLCRYGAEPASAIRPAAVLDEHDAVLALLAHGAPLDLPVAAALGRVADCKRLLEDATTDDRHLALAVAAQYGRVEIVRLLLDAGEDPDRYNPPGGHAHATPLHQAAGAGHEAVVHLLVERGARLDQQDVLWHATPADWAAHEGWHAVETYLRSHTPVA